MLGEVVSKEKAIEILNFSELDLELNDISNGLSTGMSSRIMISLALLSDSKMIFFDETFANVQEDFCKKAIEYAEKNSIQLIITTHSPKEFKQYNFSHFQLSN